MRFHHAFVAELHRRFTPRRDELLARRARRRAETGEAAFAAGRRQQAHDLLLRFCLDEDYVDSLTLPAYEQLTG